jgi:hypothetical protein
MIERNGDAAFEMSAGRVLLTSPGGLNTMGENI